MDSHLVEHLRHREASLLREETAEYGEVEAAHRMGQRLGYLCARGVIDPIDAAETGHYAIGMNMYWETMRGLDGR